MRDNQSLVPIAAAFFLGFFSIAAVFLWSGPVLADPVSLKPCKCAPERYQAASNSAKHPQPGTMRPTVATRTEPPPALRLRPSLQKRFSLGDRIAALESLQLALTHVADGSSYVWHRGHGQLSGIVRPTRSYLSKSGKVCRDLIVLFASGEQQRKTATSACRQKSGIWRING